MAVLYQYILSISCTGTPPIVDIHQHTQECLVLYVIAYAVIVDTEDTTFDAIATITPQTLQAVLLRYIYECREELDHCPKPLDQID